MKNKSIFRILITIVLLFLWFYPQIPMYKTFIEDETVLEVDEYHWDEIVSKLDSPLRVRISCKGDDLFDAFILEEKQMQVLLDWMNSDATEEPELTFLESWKGVNFVDAEGIRMPAGVYFLVLDNTSLGEAYVESSVELSYTVAEWY